MLNPIWSFDYMPKYYVRLVMERILFLVEKVEFVN